MTNKQTERYSCPHCVRNYTRESYLDNHIKKKHPAEYAKLEEARAEYTSAQAVSLLSPKAPHGPARAGDDPFAVRSFTHAGDAMTSVAAAFDGARVVTKLAQRIRNTHLSEWTMRNREQIARELDKLAFALQFLFDDLKRTDPRADREKAQKWDTLVRILPTIESFLKLALETEAQRVQTPDHDRAE